MKVLIACEESQRVCIEMRKLGHEAYSCDLLTAGGGKPEWHIQDDCLKYINGTNIFTTQDGQTHTHTHSTDGTCSSAIRPVRCSA